MRPQLTVEELLPEASALLGRPLRSWRQATAGADHLVVLATTEEGERVVLKAGAEANVDAFVLRRLSGTGVPVPRLLAEAHVTDPKEPYFLAIMTFIEGHLLAEVSEQPHRYLKPLIDAMRGVHAVTSGEGAGPVLTVAASSTRSWRDYLLDVLTGNDPEFRWAEVAQSPWVDAAVLEQALALATRQVAALSVPPCSSLLHGDLNPFNVFVGDEQITGIIDWSYARYGDRLFDFARLRMNLFVRSSAEATATYFSLLDLDDVERAREQTYFLFNLIEYVNWYVLDGSPERVRDHIDLLAKLIAR